MSLCNLEPFTQSLPINCNLIVYQLDANTTTPVVTVVRGSQEVTIASQVVATTPMTFDVPHSMVCDGETVTEIHATGYNVLEISLPGVAVGDQLQVNGVGAGMIESSAVTCPTPYAVECNASDLVECPGADDGGGCQASPAASPIVLALVLGAVVQRRRRRRS